MHEMGQKLATGRGMKQEHYAAIQSRLQDTIEFRTRELESNRKEYISCLKCNLVFHRAIIKDDGTCPNCS